MNNRMTILVDDDIKITDFLADLNERSVIRMLDQTIHDEGMTSVCLVMNCKKDNLFVVLLYNAPFGFNENGNTLMLFAHPEIKEILNYFCKFMQTVPYEDKERRSALTDIITTVQYHSERIEMQKTQTNHMG